MQRILFISKKKETLTVPFFSNTYFSLSEYTYVIINGIKIVKGAIAEGQSNAEFLSIGIRNSTNPTMKRHIPHIVNTLDPYILTFLQFSSDFLAFLKLYPYILFLFTVPRSRGTLKNIQTTLKRTFNNPKMLLVDSI